MAVDDTSLADLKQKLKKCIVDKKQNRWYLVLSWEEQYDQEELKKYRKILKKKFSSLKYVSFLFPEEKGNINDFFRCNYEFIKEELQLYFPFLFNSVYDLQMANENTLNILIKNPMQVEYAREKQLEHFLMRYFQAGGVSNINIKFLSLNKNDDTGQSIKNEDQQIIKDLQFMAEEAKRNKKPEVESGKNQILLGRAINDKPRAIADIDEEEKSIVVKGEIFDLDWLALKSGRTLVIFSLTDYEDSIGVKFFLEENQEIPADLKENNWVLARGGIKTDNYTQDLTLFARDLCLSDNPCIRTDDHSQKRLELHTHTRMSTLDATCSASELVELADEWGHKAIAITDHGVVQSFPEAFRAAKDKNIKVIYGLEGYLVNDEKHYREEAYHVIILVKNSQGLKDLYKLITDSHVKYFYRFPRIPKSELNRIRDNVIIGSACERGEIIQHMLKGASWEYLKELALFYDYIEIQPPENNEFLVRNGTYQSMEEVKALTNQVIALAKELEKPFCATSDAHFLHPWDSHYRKILMAGQGFEDLSQPPLYIKTTEDMLQAFDFIHEEDAYKAVVEYPDVIQQEIEHIIPVPQELYTPKIEGAEDYVINMTYKKARELYGDVLPEIVENRISEELSSIVDQGYAVIYLTSHKLVKKSLEDGYLVGSRGSVGSSLVATMCEITEVNPLPPHYLCPSCRFSEFVQDRSIGAGVDLPEKACPYCGQALDKDGFDIPFAVFMGFHGEKVPDIDLNFSGEYQPYAHAYTEELFGKDAVFKAGTIATIAEKTAYGFVKGYIQDHGIKCREAEINRLVRGCSGIKRTTGQHPGGLMIVPENMDVHEFSPVQRPADDPNSEVLTTHFDYQAISDRLLKLDILGHDVPTIIHMLENLTGENPLKIPMDDPDTLSIFSSTKSLGVHVEEIDCQVGTLGIPEFGTRFVRQMLEDTKPKNFSELVRISGLSHGTNVWLNNAQELVTQGKATLSDVISTRDDIMVFLMYQGLDRKDAFKIMEKVRKGKDLPEELKNKMEQADVPEWYINSCLKIKYLFPKAHAVAYTMMSFRIAYYKVNYPEAFYAAFFSVKTEDFNADLMVQGKKAVIKQLEAIEKKGFRATPKEKCEIVVLEVAREMFSRGIKVLPVCLENSDSEKFLITGDGELRPPLITLNGLGLSVAKQIVKARAEHEFTSWEDLKQRAGVPSSVLQIMKNHGCADDLPATNQLTLF